MIDCLEDTLLYSFIGISKKVIHSSGMMCLAEFSVKRLYSLSRVLRVGMFMECLNVIIKRTLFAVYSVLKTLVITDFTITL